MFLEGLNGVSGVSWDLQGISVILEGLKRHQGRFRGSHRDSKGAPRGLRCC